MKSNALRRAAPAGSALIALLALAGCDLAPVYRPPHYIVPTTWKGQGVFTLAKPGGNLLPIDWWRLLGDPELDQLEDEAGRANKTLAAAAERFGQARATVMSARSGLLPHFGLEAGASDNRESNQALFRNYGPGTETDAFYNGVASWEPDFWSKIRNRTRMAKTAAQEMAAEYAAGRLSLQAELATQYVTLRGLDTQLAIYQQAIDYFKRAVAVTSDQYQNQAASRVDLARARDRLAVAQAEQLDTQAEREVREHAIAILVNRIPAQFSIAPRPDLGLNLATIPLALPSEILQRRPDIAAAERRMAEANRAIGVARAAFYPDISLGANGGFDASGVDLASLGNSMWSYGANISLPIFEGGLRRAELQHAWAAYREKRDEYRTTVLSAFREVEDGLSRSARLNAESQRLEQAVSASREAQTLSMSLYKDGISGYLQAVTAQQDYLESRIGLVSVRVRALTAEIFLIRALGGGWTRAQLPTPDQTMTFGPLQYSHLQDAND
jgi:NodT family efflux transporter outer membrane factor (OMF) lipoprotein